MSNLDLLKDLGIKGGKQLPPGTIAGLLCRDLAACFAPASPGRRT